MIEGLCREKAEGGLLRFKCSRTRGDSFDQPIKKEYYVKAQHGEGDSHILDIKEKRGDSRCRSRVHISTRGLPGFLNRDGRLNPHYPTIFRCQGKKHTFRGDQNDKAESLLISGCSLRSSMETTFETCIIQSLISFLAGCEGQNLYCMIRLHLETGMREFHSLPMQGGDNKKLKRK